MRKSVFQATNCFTFLCCFGFRRHVENVCGEFDYSELEFHPSREPVSVSFWSALAASFVAWWADLVFPTKTTASKVNET